MKKAYIISPFLIVSAVFFFWACAKDRAVPDVTFTDAKLFALVTDTTGENLYKSSSNATQWTSTQGAHGNQFYEMKMNAKAYSACTASGKLPQGASFPDSSLIVKRLHSTSSGPVTLYAVMYKLGGTWNWAEYNPTGDVLFSIKADASGCVSCHQPSSRDFVQTFDVFP